MLGVNTPALPASLRRTNQRTIVSLLLRLGSASRADLAKAAGLSQPTAGKITSELLDLGLLQEVPAGDNHNGSGNHGLPRLGRPGQLLRLDQTRKRFLALELGVRETGIAALPVAVQLEDRWDRTFLTPRSPQAWVKELKRVAAELPDAPFWGILVSVPGIVDEAAGKSLFSPNLHWLENTDLPRLLRQVWKAPVLMVQEIRTLALGHLTAEPGGEDFFLVDFGQGVGGAIVLDGQLYSHPMPLSGEFGHTPVAGNARPCGCGAVGCLETLVSERGLLESLAAGGLSKTSRAGLRTAALPPLDASWEGLVSHVASRGIEPWLAETLDITADVIAGALNVLGIHRVVVTGRLAELPGCLEHLGRRVKQGALWGRFGDVVLQSAPHRRAAGLVAAGLDRLVLPQNEEQGLTVQHSK